MVQWQRICAPDAGFMGSIPSQGTRSRMPQLKSCTPQGRLKSLHVETKTWRSQINKGKKNPHHPLFIHLLWTSKAFRVIITELNLLKSLQIDFQTKFGDLYIFLFIFLSHPDIALDNTKGRSSRNHREKKPGGIYLKSINIYTWVAVVIFFNLFKKLWIKEICHFNHF